MVVQVQVEYQNETQIGAQQGGKGAGRACSHAQRRQHEHAKRCAHMLRKGNMRAVGILEDQLLSTPPLVVALGVLNPLDSHVLHLQARMQGVEAVRKKEDTAGAVTLQLVTYRPAIDDDVAAPKVLGLVRRAARGQL